jgi:hypothetical protein
MFAHWSFAFGTGYAMLILGAPIAAFNFYNSFLRYPIYKLLGCPYRWQSGLPAVGTFFLTWAILVLAFHHAWTATWVCLCLIALDTGGIPWFTGTMIWFWLRPPASSETANAVNEPPPPPTR